MGQSFFFSLHFLWILLVAVNFIIQLAYYFNDMNNRLFLAKKITTPLLLFGGLLIVILATKSFPVIPSVILVAMGLGELGIEGSSVVESREEDKDQEKGASIIVTLAGVLFLLVNIYIGVTLFIQNGETAMIVTGLAIGTFIISALFLLVFKMYKPKSETRVQIILYSIGLIILCGGTITNILGGISNLGIAAAILTVSDSLVLYRMGANFNKNTDSGFKTLLAFLVVILLLYYIYMGVLIHIGSPFLI